MLIPAVTPVADIGRSFVSLMLESGGFAKTILLLLFVMSVLSWAIIYDRAMLYRRLRRGGRLLQSAVAAKGLSLSRQTIERGMPSVEGALIQEARRYLDNLGGAPPSIERLRQVLEGRAVSEISEMEKYLIFLSTTASVSPFLGLLGTVWGIMSSFLAMGTQGTASIEVVGPGIAEALVTTIAGLGAAIAALVGYNLLIRYVRRQESRIELLISRILALSGERQANNPTMRREEASYEEKPV